MADVGQLSREPHVTPTVHMADVAHQLVIVVRRRIIVALDARVVVPAEVAAEGPQRAQDQQHPHDLTVDAVRLSREPHVTPMAHMADAAHQLVIVVRRRIIVALDARVAVPAQVAAEGPQRAQDQQHPHDLTVDAVRLSREPHVTPMARMADAARQLVIVARRRIIVALDARVVVPAEEPQRAQEQQQHHDLTGDAVQLSREPHAMPTAPMADAAHRQVIVARPQLIAALDARVVAPPEEPQEPQRAQEQQQHHDLTVDAVLLFQEPHVIPTARMVDAARQLVIVARRRLIAALDVRVVAPPEEPQEPQRPHQQPHALMADAVLLSREPHVTPVEHMVVAVHQQVIVARRRLIAGLDARVVVPPGGPQGPHQQPHDLMADVVRLSREPHVTPVEHMVAAVHQQVIVARRRLIAVLVARVVVAAEESQRNPDWPLRLSPPFDQTWSKGTFREMLSGNDQS
ncbi:hypothetical protein G7Y79_00012g032620 [Physcia stellaris]|nr:hypothetical protein G7Y79_00012g032620 [Physcia stellaris]